MKKLSALLVAVSTASLLAANSMPPMPPSFPTGKKEEKRPFPKSCKSIPMMIIHLPPPMELEFNECKNELHMPTDGKSEAVLKAHFGKGAKFKSISVSEDFHRLYKIDFFLDGKEKTIFANESLTKFVEAPMVEFKKAKPSSIPTPSTSTKK
jgi:hypothetical protein